MTDTPYDSIDALDIRTAASRIGVSSRTMHRLVSTGELRSIKLGRRRLVRVNVLRDYLDALETSPADAA